MRRDVHAVLAEYDQATVATTEGKMDKDKTVMVRGEVGDTVYEQPVDVVANLMDDELREELHSTMVDAAPQAFVDAYCERHLAKFGEHFRVN